MFFKRKKQPITVLLDIDGVFNPILKIEEPREIIEHPYGVWQVSVKNLEFLKYLAEHYNCMWISSWQEESNYINDFIGIKYFKCVSIGDNKHDGVTEALEKYKKVIAIDDELIDGRIRMFHPIENIGITEEMRQDILEYLKELEKE